MYKASIPIYAYVCISEERFFRREVCKPLNCKAPGLNCRSAVFKRLNPQIAPIDYLVHFSLSLDGNYSLPDTWQDPRGEVSRHPCRRLYCRSGK